MLSSTWSRMWIYSVLTVNYNPRHERERASVAPSHFIWHLKHIVTMVHNNLLYL